VILKRAQKAIPPPPPPDPKVVPKVDNRSELEKAYDRATDILVKEKEKEESIREESKWQVDNVANIAS
jgi:hypothetical protein